MRTSPACPRQIRSRLPHVDAERLVSSDGLPCSSKSTQPAFGVISIRRVQKPGTADVDVAQRDGARDERKPVLVLLPARVLPGREEQQRDQEDEARFACEGYRPRPPSPVDSGDAPTPQTAPAAAACRRAHRPGAPAPTVRASSGCPGAAPSIRSSPERSPPRTPCTSSAPTSSRCRYVRPRPRARAAATGCATATPSTCASRGGTAALRSASSTSWGTSSTISSGTSSAPTWASGRPRGVRGLARGRRAAPVPAARGRRPLAAPLLQLVEGAVGAQLRADRP